MDYSILIISIMYGLIHQYEKGKILFLSYFSDRNKNICAGEDCQPQGTELVGPSVPSQTHSFNEQYTLYPNGNTHTTESAEETRLKNKETAPINIFLIVGIAAAVLVALIILAIALYKFWGQNEGSYRVDESQNFAYLEAKKHQTNGAVVHNNGNANKVGKKKDVKEWYV